MRKWLYGSLVVAVLAAVWLGEAQAQKYLQDHKYTELSHPNPVIDDADMNASGHWTGWLPVSKYASVAFDIELTDANDSVTAVTMRCEASSVSSTANDGGHDIPVIASTSATGTSTSVVHTWSHATASSKFFTWTVGNLPNKWVNCFFDTTGTPASIDTLDVNWRGISP